jgi:hypothetical protein
MAQIAIGRRGGLTLLSLVAVVVGVVLVVVAVLAQQSAPRPPRSAGAVDPGPSTSSASGKASTAPSKAAAPPLGASRPSSISIPAIGVRSTVNPIGLNGDGTLAVPQPGPHLDQAAWFQNSPTPGQPGPSIIEGHVDSDRGPSVFFRLGRLRPGDAIHVTRADGVRVTFTVNAIRDYKKTRFPTDIVYGAKDLGRPQLRLITCSQFDPSIRHHVGNAVVFAHLTSTRR